VYLCGCGHVVAGAHYANGVGENNKKDDCRMVQMNIKNNAANKETWDNL
jgi:hypothetical protein